MSKKMWIISAVGVIAVTGAVLLTVCKQKATHKKKLAVISDAGYETAHDVHFPLRHNRVGRKSRV